MALRPIVTLPNLVLKRKAKPITKFDKNLQTLIDDMIETMRDAPGVGLAAPQVDISEQLIVVEYSEDDDDDDEGDEEKPEKLKKLYVMINPEIVKTSEEKVLGVEGCLSIPGIQGEVERFEAIQVKGLNRFGKPQKLKLKGWMARIFQHEIDHLNGILFTDLATRLWKFQEEEEHEL
ncbi:MAG: peptide deformylase [Anaerolineales bacterium]|nr:peptide deformylase [Anaerolineales bacterium]